MRKVGTVLQDVNVRRQPGSAQEDVIGVLKAGDKIEIIDERQGGLAHWLQFPFAGGEGGRAWVAERNSKKHYVAVALLPDTPPAPPPRPPRPEPVDDWSRLILWSGIAALVLIPLLAWWLG